MNTEDYRIENRYSDDMSSDRHGRWMRIMYYKNLYCIGFITMAEFENKTVYIANPKFPTNTNLEPNTPANFENYDEARIFLMTEFERFRLVISEQNLSNLNIEQMKEFEQWKFKQKEKVRSKWIFSFFLALIFFLLIIGGLQTCENLSHC